MLCAGSPDIPEAASYILIVNHSCKVLDGRDEEMVKTTLDLLVQAAFCHGIE